MRFALGLVIGLLLGGGAVYLALERPWTSWSQSEAQPDAGVATAGTGKGKSKRRRKRRGSSSKHSQSGEIPTLTARDRKMLWKGDAVELPRDRLDFTNSPEGAEGEGRSLSAGEINRAIKSQSDAMLACIANARGNAQLSAEIKVKMLVDPGGKVTRVRLRAPRYLFGHGFNGCARKAARSMRFPATGGYTVVDAPYDLY